MNGYKIAFVLLLLIANISMGPSLASTDVAWSPQTMVIFGDGLSDNGNTFYRYGFPVSPPYWQGRFSNGPVWSEYLAHQFRLIPDPKKRPNYNRRNHFLNFSTAFALVLPQNIPSMVYPYGGPTLNGIDGFRVATLRQQVNEYLQLHRPLSSDNTVAILWIGQHDLESITCLKQPLDCMHSVMGEISSNIERLYAAGITHYVVITLPGGSTIPGLVERFDPNRLRELEQLTTLYNSLYYSMRTEVKARHIDLRMIIFNLALYQNPLSSNIRYPHKNCINGNFYQNTASNTCTDPDNYLWYGLYTSTTLSQQYLAEAIYNAMLSDTTWNIPKPWWPHNWSDT